MEMEKIKSRNRFNRAVWWVLDRINEERLFNQSNIVSYRVNLDITRENEVGLLRENQVIKFLKDKSVITEIDKPISAEVGERLTPKYRAYEIHKFQISDNFDEVYREYTNLLEKGLDPSSLFGFDNMTFRLKRIDSTDAVINFYPKKGEGTKLYYLMRVLVAELKKEGKRNGEWIEAFVKQERIIDLIKKQCPNENNVDSNWIKNTKGNLIKKIPQEYEYLIKIGGFNQKLEGYSFSLKIPS